VERAKITELEEPREALMAIKVYKNKDLVRIRIKRKFYERLEEEAKRLGTTPDVLMRMRNAFSIVISRWKCA